LFNPVLEWLRLPELRGIKDLDDPAVTRLHAQIIWKKIFLRKIYLDFYCEYKRIIRGKPSGVCVELGSGGGFAKKIFSTILTSDIAPSPGLDFCFSAEQLPFKDTSIDALCMINVFHHIKNPVNALNEFSRCLKPGGVILMIEPANTIWARFVYRRFHHERFDPAAAWSVEGQRRLSDANGALPWIIFRRDRGRFESQYPLLKVSRVEFHTPLRYLLSGGLSLKQLLPSCAYRGVKGIESLLSPLNEWIGMFCTIEVRKQGAKE